LKQIELNKINYPTKNEQLFEIVNIEDQSFQKLRILKNKVKKRKIATLNQLGNIKNDFYKYANSLNFNNKDYDKYWNRLIDFIFKTFKKQSKDCSKYLKYTKGSRSTFNKMVEYLEKAKERVARPSNTYSVANKYGGNPKKIRKHKGIIQSGINKGKLKNGYKYTGNKLISGLSEIKKI
jgi:hypothetical protein